MSTFVMYNQLLGIQTMCDLRRCDLSELKRSFQCQRSYSRPHRLVTHLCETNERQLCITLDHMILGWIVRIDQYEIYIASETVIIKK